MRPPDALRANAQPGWRNMDGAVVLPSTEVTGGQSYINTEINTFPDGWLTPINFFFWESMLLAIARALLHLRPSPQTRSWGTRKLMQIAMD
ncbi:MAG: hypothetical protein H7069_03590 [Phormidesmis sp. FL-bin-119]|nr:hypothetical protein [Pedobacter sp.]